MKGNGPHPAMKIIKPNNFMMAPRLRASPRHGGAVRVYKYACRHWSAAEVIATALALPEITVTVEFLWEILALFFPTLLLGYGQ